VAGQKSLDGDTHVGAAKVISLHLRYYLDFKIQRCADTLKSTSVRGFSLVLRDKIYGEGKLGRYFLGIGFKLDFNRGG
jgi:hypothetical protein